MKMYGGIEVYHDCSEVSGQLHALSTLLPYTQPPVPIE
jgi:hypothetical protein